AVRDCWALCFLDSPRAAALPHRTEDDVCAWRFVRTNQPLSRLAVSRCSRHAIRGAHLLPRHGSDRAVCIAVCAGFGGATLLACGPRRSHHAHLDRRHPARLARGYLSMSVASVYIANARLAIRTSLSDRTNFVLQSIGMIVNDGFFLVLWFMF